MFYKSENDGEGRSLESVFKLWRKSTNTATMIVQCDKRHADAVISAITAAGGKIMK